jgi:hypothetical protein
MLNNILSGWRPAITKIFAIIGVVSLLAVCVPVIAAAFFVENKWECAKTSLLQEGLEINGEKIIASGTVFNEALVMTFWANPEGEWSILVTPISEPEHSCITLYGTKFRTLKLKTFI